MSAVKNGGVMTLAYFAATGPEFAVSELNIILESRHKFLQSECNWLPKYLASTDTSNMIFKFILPSHERQNYNLSALHYRGYEGIPTSHWAELAKS